MPLSETGHAYFTLTDRMLQQLLRLPDGIGIRGIWFSPMHGAFLVHLEGDRLPRVEEGSESPRLYTRNRVYEVSDLHYETVYDILLNDEPIGHIGVERDVSDGEEPPAWTR